MTNLFRHVPRIILGVSLLVALNAAPCLAEGPPKNTGKEQSRGAPLSLSEAFVLTLRHNQELAAYSEEIRAREAEAMQSGLRPNPLLSFEMENVLGGGDFSGTEAAETTLSISQPIELGGKRSRRRALAEADTVIAQGDYSLAKAEVLARTADSFIAVLVAQERQQLTEELAGIAKQVLHNVEERISAGKAAATESLRARIQWRELEVSREKARRELAAARHSLAARMGLEAAGFGTVAGDLAQMGDLPDLTEMEHLADKSPRIARRTAEIESRRRAADLEAARRIPDVEVALGARYLRESDDTALVAGISVPLPLFNRNQGAIAAARSRLAQARAEEQDALLQTRVAISTAWQEMAAAQEHVLALRDDILPAARQALEAADYGYRAGKFGILDVLDAQSTLIEAQERHLEALADFHRSAIELNRLIGTESSESRQSAPVSVFTKE